MLQKIATDGALAAGRGAPCQRRKRKLRANRFASIDATKERVGIGLPSGPALLQRGVMDIEPPEFSSSLITAQLGFCALARITDQCCKIAAP
jgi:hypothetical protein